MSVAVAVGGANDVAHDGGHARGAPTAVAQDCTAWDGGDLLHGVAR